MYLTRLQKKFPGNFYSALSGFIEPGEAFEDAVKREIWEEAGVRVWDVRYHSGQPWPYPANLMIGFYATADSSKPIRLDLDNELEDAQWYTRAQVLSILHHPRGSHFGGRDRRVVQASPNAQDVTKDTAVRSREGEPPFMLPPVTAIAGVLIRDWAEGKVQFGSGKTQKGNL